MTFDLNTLFRQLSNLGGTPSLVLGFAAIIAYLQWKNGNIPALLASIFKPTNTFSSKEESPDNNRLTFRTVDNTKEDSLDREDDSDSRAAALVAIDYLTDYFDTHACPEGKAAAQAVGPFLFKIDKPVDFL